MPTAQVTLCRLEPTTIMNLSSSFSAFTSQNIYLPTSFIFYFLSYTAFNPVVRFSPIGLSVFLLPMYGHMGPPGLSYWDPKTAWSVSQPANLVGRYIWRMLTGVYIYILRMSIYWSIRLHCILFLFIFSIAWGGGVSSPCWFTVPPSFQVAPFRLLIYIFIEDISIVYRHV